MRRSTIRLTWYFAVEREIRASLLRSPLVKTVPRREYAEITSVGKGMDKSTILLNSSAAVLAAIADAHFLLR